MKTIISLIFLIGLSSVTAQRYKSSESNIRFFSDAPLEDIEAVNTKASSIIDTETGSVVFVVPITSFQFKKKLMQEHFNENYMESDKYPNAVFKGKIEDWNGELISKEAVASGEMEIHGVKQQVEIVGNILKTANEFSISSVFPVKLEDHDIDIPKAVFYKIAEEVEVTVNFKYAPYEKD